ncbi:MAG: pilus assembly protein PilM, partial [Lachnospiraceae bacterium]
GSLVMQMNETATVLTVIDKGEMGVQRTISYGTCTLADALVESRCYDEANTQAAALRLLQEQNFLSTGEADDDLWRKKELARIVENRFRRIENDQNAAEDEAAAANDLSVERALSDEEILRRRVGAREEVSEAGRMVIGKIRRVIEYYTTNHPDTSVQKIYITGPGTAIVGIEAMLSAELELPVEIYNVTEGVVFAKGVKELEERGAEFFACLGATINPLGIRPADAELKEKKKNIAILSATIFIAAAAIIAYLVVDAALGIRYEKEMKATFEQRIEQAQGIEQLYQVYLASQESIATMAVTDALSFSMAEQLNEIIAALEKALPARSLVHSFSVSGDTMTVNFSTVTKEEAAKVLMQLQTIPYITEVTVAGIVENVDETTNRTEVVFTVNCKLQRYIALPGNQTDGAVTEGTEVQ